MKKLLLLLAMLLIPTTVQAQAYNLTLAPFDQTTKYLHRDLVWTGTGQLDTLMCGGGFDHIKIWLTAGSSATFTARLIPISNNSLKQTGTAPPAASQAKANWGGTLNETAFHTYAVTDVCEFSHSAPIWKGVIVQTSAGSTPLNISFDRMDPVAWTR